MQANKNVIGKCYTVKMFRATCVATAQSGQRCSYMKGGVTLSNVSCNLSQNVDRKELGHIVKFGREYKFGVANYEVAGGV